MPTAIPNEPVEDLMTMLRAVNPQEEPKMLSNFKDFLERGLALDPHKRLTPEEALQHPFLGLKVRMVPLVSIIPRAKKQY